MTSFQLRRADHRIPLSLETTGRRPNHLHYHHQLLLKVLRGLQAVLVSQPDGFYLCFDLIISVYENNTPTTDKPTPLSREPQHPCHPSQQRPGNSHAGIHVLAATLSPRGTKSLQVTKRLGGHTGRATRCAHETPHFRNPIYGYRHRIPTWRRNILAWINVRIS